jgi:hypothetical protein
VKPRNFNLSWVLTRDTIYDDLDELYNVIGQNPLAMILCDSLNNPMKWCGYFHIIDPPSGSMTSPVYAMAGLQIREAV